MRNIEFPSDPTLGEIKIGGNEAFIAGLLSTVQKASRPVPGHHHSSEIGKRAFDQRRHIAIRTAVLGLLHCCYNSDTALLQRFVRFYDTTIRRYRLVHVWAARKTSVALSAARLGDILNKPAEPTSNQYKKLRRR